MFSAEVEVFAVPITIDAFAARRRDPAKPCPDERRCAAKQHLIGFERAWETGRTGTGE
jgi:hypothetical protein